MQRNGTPPTSSRGSGSGRATSTAMSSVRQPARRGGGIQKRGAHIKTDIDGDLDMDGAAGKNGRGGAGRSRARARKDPSSQAVNGIIAREGRRSSPAGPQRGIFSGATLQKAIARGLAVADANLRDSKRAATTLDQVMREASGKHKGRERDADLDQLIVRGLSESKAATNADGGIRSLLDFLVNKANRISRVDMPREEVRIRKSRSQGDAVILFVPKESSTWILNLHGFCFAGATLAIEMYQPATNKGTSSTTIASTMSEETRSTRDKLTGILSRRYNPQLKLLDLSALGKDPELVGLGTFDRNSTTSKFFPALMAICDSMFVDDVQKREAVTSVSLADNDLNTLANVTTLAQTFPDLRNLDLSKNKLETMVAMQVWRWKFRHLDHLVLTGNPIEKVDAGYKDDVLKWYPALRLLNGITVRTQEEIATIVAGKVPLAILGASFRDEGQIAENFVKQFFPAYDTDRNALANNFYDIKSTFSYNINTSAPRAATTTTDKSLPQDWEVYIKGSRNLMKIRHLPARMSRVHTGPESIRQRWASLPATRHPPLLEDGRKWLIECHSIPGLPDPTGQAPAGVGGLLVMVHGEFSEVNVATGQVTATRSFDRTFVLGPGGTTAVPIRVISDILTYRAYGGCEAWIAEDTAVVPPVVDAVVTPIGPGEIAQPIILPDGFGQALAGKTAEQVQQEQMMIEMSKRTRMTLPYSKLCLEEKAWNFEESLLAFEAVKGQLPADAFM